MAIQRAPGLLHSMGKIRVSLLQEVLFAIDAYNSFGLSKYGHYTAQAQKSLLEQLTRHFSFWEGRGLVTSKLVW